MSTQELIEKYRSVVVQIATSSGSGTGVYLPDAQLIVTNYHVIKDNWTATIKGNFLEKQTGKVVYTNPRWDLAFIQLEDKLELNESLISENNDLHDGDTVIAIGHPFGLNYTATQGVVSRVDRIQNGITYIQIDTAINPGNSGGPLIHLHGKIIGINTFIIQNADNIGFALPVKYVQDAITAYLPFHGMQTTCCASCGCIVHNENVDMEKYCPDCGTEVQLPPKEQNDVNDNNGDVPALIEDALVLRGLPRNLCQNGINKWSIDFGEANINIIYQPEKQVIFLDGSMGELPKQNIKALYEYLLRESCNDQLHYFFTVQENIYLSAAITNMDITAQKCAEIFHDIFEKSDDYLAILRKQFGCPPPKYMN